MFLFGTALKQRVCATFISHFPKRACFVHDHMSVYWFTSFYPSTTSQVTKTSAKCYLHNLIAKSGTNNSGWLFNWKCWPIFLFSHFLIKTLVFVHLTHVIYEVAYDSGNPICLGAKQFQVFWPQVLFQFAFLHQKPNPLPSPPLNPQKLLL